MCAVTRRKEQTHNLDGIFMRKTPPITCGYKSECEIMLEHKNRFMVAIKIPELGYSTTVYLSNVLILSSLAIISACISALLVAAPIAEKSLVAALIAEKSLVAALIAEKSLVAALIAEKSLVAALIAEKSLVAALIAEKSLVAALIAEKSLVAAGLLLAAGLFLKGIW